MTVSGNDWGGLTTSLANDFDIIRDSVNAPVRLASLFGYTDTLVATSSTTDYGSWVNDGSDTLIITTIRVWGRHGIGVTDTVGIQFTLNDSMAVVSSQNTNVFSATWAVGYYEGLTTAGETTTTFSNYKVPPGYYLWMTTPTIVAGYKPAVLNVYVSGYYKRNY
jgi:hypothetical protein